MTPPAARRARSEALATVSLLALAAAALVPAVFRPDHLLYRRDLLDFFYPMKVHLVRTLAAGEIPWWNPWTLGGEPFFANLQSQVFYPPNWLLLAVPLPWGLSALTFLHLVLGGSGARSLARRLGDSELASLTCGLAFMAGGFFVCLVDLHNQLCALAWMPWTCSAAVAHARSASLRSLGAWASAASLALLAGEPQIALLGGALSLGIALAVRRRGEPARRGATLRGAALVVAIVAGCCAFQLGPLTELFALSDRLGPEAYHAGGRYALSLPAVAAFALRPDGPQDAPAGKYVRSLYVGAVTLPFALLGALRRRRLERALLAVTVISILLAASPSLPLLGDALAGAAPFLRYPMKYVALASLALPLLAGSGLTVAARLLGLRLARRRPGGSRLALAATLVVPAALLVDLVASHHGFVPSLPADAVLRRTEVIALLAAQTGADGPRVHASPLNRQRLVSRAARRGDPDALPAQRERVELLEGALPLVFEVHATWGASAMTPREQAALLARTTGPLDTDLARELKAGFVLDTSERRLPLPLVPAEGGAARLYVLEPAAAFPQREWRGSNVAVGEPGMPAPSTYPGWREGPPGTWTFRPRGIVPLAILSALAWTLVLALLVAGWRGAAPRVI